MDHEPGVKGEESEAEWRRAFFEYVWPLNPRKIGKMAALSVWMGVKYRPRNQETLDSVLTALERVAPEWRERVNSGEENFVPHLRTWLYQQRHMDEDV